MKVPALPAAGGAVRRWTAVLLSTTLIGVFVAVASSAEGFHRSQAAFNDGAVWQADGSRNEVGQVKLDLGVPGASLALGETTKSLIEVEQSRAGVVVVDQTKAQLHLLNDKTLTKASTLKLDNAVNIVVRLTDTGLMLANTESGAVRFMPSAALFTTVDLDAVAPLASAPDAAAGPISAETSVDGRVLSYELRTGLLTIYNKDGVLDEAIRLPGADGRPADLGMVGSTPLVLRREAGQLVIIGKSSQLSVSLGRNWRLAMPSQSGTKVVVVDPQGTHHSIDLNSGTIVALNLTVGPDPIRPLVDVKGLVVGASEATKVVKRITADGQVGPEQLLKSSRLQGRLIWGQPYVDDLGTDEGVGFDTLGEGQNLRAGAIDNAIANGGNVSTTLPGAGADTSDPGSAAGRTNHPPTIQNDMELRVRPGRSSRLYLLDNDSDPDVDDVLVVTEILDAPADATLSIAPSGNGVVLSPDAGFEGELTFRYTAADAADQSASANVKVRVTSTGNEPPLAIDDSITATVGQAVLINVLDNDRDPDGDAMTVTHVDSSNGTASVTPGGLLSFVPSQAGTAELAYTVADERDEVTAAKLFVSINAPEQDQQPVLRPDVFVAGMVDTQLDVLANDIDPDGSALKIVGFTSQTDVGTLELRGDALWLVPSREGTATFTYEATDGTSNQESHVRVDVRSSPGNRPPIAVPDRVTMAVGTSVEVDLLANDHDPDNDVLAVVGWNSPEQQVAISPKGSNRVRIAVVATTNSPLALSYTVSDGTGSVTSTILVVVRPSSEAAPPAPLARDDDAVARIGIGRSIAVLANDVDPSGGPLKITEVTSAPAGVTANSNGTRVLIAASATNGPAGQLIEFGYSVATVTGESDTARVSMRLVPAEGTNTAPVAVVDRVVVTDGRTISVPVLANDTDHEGDTLSVVRFGLPARGLVTKDGAVLRYTPTAGQRGTDRFTYTIEDGHGGSATGAIEVGILPSPVRNRPPVAVDDGPITVLAGAPGLSVDVLSNDSDPDQDAIKLIKIDAPPTGTAVIVGGRIKYTPPPSINSPSQITIRYEIADPSLAIASATLTVALAPPSRGSRPPLARPDKVGPVVPGGQVQIDVVLNDEDPDGPTSALRVTELTTGDVAPDGRMVTLTAPSKSVVVQYTVKDADGLTATGTLEVTVSGDRPPVALEDRASVLPGKSIDINVLANDSDPEGQPLTLESVSAPVGTVSKRGTRLRYSALATASGEVRLTYVVADGAGNVATGTVLVAILGTKPSTSTVPTSTPTGGRSAQTTLARPVGVTTRVDNGGTSAAPRTTAVLRTTLPTVSTTSGRTLARPAAPSVALAGTRIVAQWTAVAGAASYDVEIEGQSAVSTSELTLTSSELTGGKEHRVRVRAADGQTQSEWSDWSPSVRVVDRPSRPRNAAGRVSAKGKVLVTWEIASDGGSPVESGSVTCDGGSALFAGSQTQVEFVLASGNGKSCKVMLRNRVGESDPATLVVGRAAGRKPDAPTNAQAKKGDAQATITWQAGDDDVDTYEIVASSGQRQSTPATATSVVVTGLENGKQVTFTVFTGTDGVRSDGAVTGPVVPAGKPLVVPSFAARHNGNGELALSWTVAGDNGAKLDGYDIACDGGSPATALGTETSKTVTVPARPSPAGKSCRITPRNSEGSGPVATTIIVARDAPTAPGKPVGTRGDKKVTLTWTAPSGPVPDDYIVSVSNGTPVTIDGASPTYVWNGLANGTAYTFTVIAVIDGKNSLPSTASDPVKPGAVPGPPVNPSTTPPDGRQSDREFDFHWSPPAQDGGYPVTEYRISGCGVAGSTLPAVPGSNRMSAALIRTQFTTCTMSIVAVNDVGASSAATYSYAYTPLQVDITLATSIVSGAKKGPEAIKWSFICPAIQSTPTETVTPVGSTGSMRVSAFRDSGCKMTVSAQGTDASFKNFVVGGAATGTGTAAAPVASDPPLASMWNGALSYTAAASFFVPATATITGVATTETAATIAYTISGDMAAGSQCELVVKQTGARIASPCAAGANSIAAAGLASGTSYDFSVTGTGATGATFVSAEVPGTTKVVIQDVTLFDALGAPTTGEFTCSRNNSRGPASWAIQPFVVPSGVKTLTAVTVGVGASDGFTVMIQRGGSAIWSVRAPGGFDQNASFAASIPVTPGETLELWVGDASGWTNGGTRSPSQLFSVVRALGDYIQGGDYRTTNACQGQAPGAQTFSGTDMSAKIVGRTG